MEIWTFYEILQIYADLWTFEDILYFFGHLSTLRTFVNDPDVLSISYEYDLACKFKLTAGASTKCDFRLVLV